MKPQSSLSRAFRNARHLYFPFFLGEREPRVGSVMNGVLPGTQDWFELYETKEDGQAFDRIWERFRQRHNVAQERARIWRQFVGNEALVVQQSTGELAVSSLQPEVNYVGCVGRSMHMADIRYMDILAVYPICQEPVAEYWGDPETVENGTQKYSDFRIHIGDDVVIEPGHIAELCYLDEALNSALKTCPQEYLDWARDLHKVRQIDCVKVARDGRISVGVSTNRDSLKPGLDHDLSNIKGRVFSRYSRENYETRLRNANVWKQLSVAARHADFLKPESDWSALFSSLSDNDRRLVEGSLLGNVVADDQAIDDVLTGLSAKEKLAALGLASPTLRSA